MELIFEIIAELVVQLVFEVVITTCGRAIGSVLETKIGRVIASATVMGAIGYGGGYAWGRHVADIGHQGVPSSIWVSLGLAILAGSLAVRARSDSDFEARFAFLPTGLRPTAERLALLSFLNVTLAIGVAAGFSG
jgi:hypothetical protein